ncbi:MAG: superoxide dismutase [Alphaproteobacteria bacterium]|nr:superoxide dismutase [Alphaproteobacteria bacterium]
MIFELPPLPYQLNALEPYISEQTMSYHYGKHHQAYIDNLNKLIKNTKFENMPMEEIIIKTAGKSEFSGVFNNAAQSWNHTFFWNTMKPNGGGEPTGELKKKIDRDFGSYDKFKAEFINAAVSQFGSGWAWLAEDKDNGKLVIIKTANGDNPIAHGLIPIIGLDVWEHAYYLDYQNRRADYINNYLNHLVKWN